MPAHEPLTDPLIEDAFYAGDAFSHYARLRDEAPVAWNDTKGFWAVSRRFASSRGQRVLLRDGRNAQSANRVRTGRPAHLLTRSGGSNTPNSSVRISIPSACRSRSHERLHGGRSRARGIGP